MSSQKRADANGAGERAVAGDEHEVLVDELVHELGVLVDELGALVDELDELGALVDELDELGGKVEDPSARERVQTRWNWRPTSSRAAGVTSSSVSTGTVPHRRRTGVARRL
jgi:hypothetical protein